MPGPKQQLPDLPQRGQVLFRTTSPGGVSCKQCCTHTVYLAAQCSHWHEWIAAYREVLRSMVSRSSRRRPERLLWRAAHADIVLHSRLLPGVRLGLHQALQFCSEPHSNRPLCLPRDPCLLADCHYIWHCCTSDPCLLYSSSQQWGNCHWISQQSCCLQISQDFSENVAFKHSSSLDSSHKYAGALRAVPRSNSMPTQQSAARAQSAASRARAASRSASRGRQGLLPLSLGGLTLY